MAENLTPPHESGSHASDHPNDVGETIEAKAEAASVEPIPPQAAEPSKRQPIPVAVEVSGSQQTFDKGLKLAQGYWVKVQPILQEKSVQALLWGNRFTNDFLDKTWPKLSAQAIALIPASTKTKIAEQKTKLQPTLDTIQPLWDKGAVPLWHKVVVPTWNKGLALLRQQLPSTLQELTNRFLTVAILSTMVVIYWVFSSLTSGQPAAAKQPPIPTKPVLTRPAPITQRPSLQPSRPPVPTVKPTTAPRPTAPVVPLSETAIPKPIPSPEMDLAEIQSQLASVVADTGENLIASVKATPRQSLKVSLGTDWNSLSPSQQATVGQKLWQRSQKLQFKQFELFDSTNIRVARSPVVGDQVVFLQHPTVSVPE